MQRQIYYFLFFLLMQNVSFSQSIEQVINPQFDKVITSVMVGHEFIVGAYTRNQVFIVTKTKDSLFVTTYLATMSNVVGGVFSISVNADTLFKKTIDTLYNDVKQNHSYQLYSKKALTGDDFFLAFDENNKKQIFSRRGASLDQLNKINFIVDRLKIYAIIPYKGYSKRLKPLNIKNWNELLKYLKSGTVVNVSK